jgi:hypothetical protein
VKARRAVPLVACACAAAILPLGAAATEIEGPFGVEVGGGYANTAPRTAAYPNSLNGGAARARLSYDLTDALGVAAVAQISWFESRRPLVEIEYEDETGALVTGVAYGDAITRTRLQELGLGLIYALDVLRVVPFLSAGVSSLREVERAGSREVTGYDVVLWMEVGADLAVTERFRVGASAIFDLFLTERTELSGQTTFLVRAGVALGPAKAGRR